MSTIFNLWAKLGGVISLVILTLLFIRNTPLDPLESLFVIHFCLLLLHQVEEYVIPGNFKAYFNTNIYGKNSVMKSKLTEAGILIVNVFLGWTAYGISAWHTTTMLWLAVGLILITLLNGVLHTTLAFVQRQYNPGLLTGSMLFIPFSLYFLFRLHPLLSANDWIIGAAIWIFGSMMIPVGIFISGKLFPDKT